MENELMNNLCCCECDFKFQMRFSYELQIHLYTEVRMIKSTKREMLKRYE